jgi:hypothetical protein
MPQESKAELTDRLRREGRWDAFVRRREELKSQNVPAEEAWHTAAEEFPPLETASDAGGSTCEMIPEEDAESLWEKLQKNGWPDMHQIVAWVFNALDMPDMHPADAPSGSAWSLLMWVRASSRHREVFLTSFLRTWPPAGYYDEDEEL